MNKKINKLCGHILTIKPSLRCGMKRGNDTQPQYTSKKRLSKKNVRFWSLFVLTMLTEGYNTDD